MRTIKKHWGLGFWGTALILVIGALWAFQNGLFQKLPTITNQAQASAKPDITAEQTPNPARREVVEKRTETSQTFDNGDGTFTAEIYTAPINYEDQSGNLKPISTKVMQVPVVPQSLFASKAGNPLDVYGYSAEENSIRAYFKEKANEGDMFRAEVGDYYVSWQPLSMSWVYPDGTKEVIATVQGVDSFIDNNKVIYYDLFPDTDNEFEILPGKIKDRVIFYSAPPASETIPEKLIVEGILNVDPSLSFYVNGVNQTGDFSTSLPIELRNGKNEIVMVLDAPVSFEYGDPHQSISSAYSISSSSGQIYLSISAPSTWILDPGRNYPIIIDPTIGPISPFGDSWVSYGHPDTNFGSDSNLMSGLDRGVIEDDIISMALIQFPASIISSSSGSVCPKSFINSAVFPVYINTVDNSTGSSTYYYLNSPSCSWDWSTVTWNNFCRSYYPTGEDSIYVSVSGVGSYNFNPIYIVQQWSNGSSNYTPMRGFLITNYSRSTQPDADDWIYINSVSLANPPRLTIIFTPPTDIPCNGLDEDCTGADADQCTPGSTCCDASGCNLPAGSDCPGICSVCNSAGVCSGYPADDSACGTIDCDGLDTSCRNYTDLTSNRCEGLNNCKDANTSDCTSYSNYSAGTDCPGTCSVCDGAGSCSSYPIDDSACGTIDCDGLDNACRGYNDLTSNRCEGLNDCKDPNSGDCTSYSNYSAGTDCPGTCSVCDGAGSCSSYPTDDSACGTIDCDGLDTLCRNYNDLTTNRCEGIGDCKDANSASDCTSYSNSSSTTSCNDSQVCTISDHCDGLGTCIGGGANLCNDSNTCTTDSCNVALNRCENVPAGLCCFDTDCDDGEPCTTDVCNNPGAGSSCSHTNNSNPCNDGDWCNGNDTCNGGTCSNHAGRTCDDGSACTTDSCNNALQRCDFIPTGVCCTAADCNDSNPCTADVCNNPGPASSCSYSNESFGTNCGSGLICDGSGNCVVCTPDCAGQVCGGDDGCGGNCQTGSCPTHETCDAGQCICPDNDSDGYEDDACGGNDCNDDNAAVHPGTTDKCENGIDEDCSGADRKCPPDDGCTGGCCSCAAIAPQNASRGMTLQAGAFNGLVYLLPLLGWVAVRIRRQRRKAG